MATVVEVMTMFALRVRFKPRRRRRQRLFMGLLNDIPVSAITVVAFLLQQMSQITRWTNVEVKWKAQRLGIN